MASSMFVKVTFLAIICLVLDIPLANAEQTCGEITDTLLPCLPYLMDQEPTAPETCCNGVRTVTDQATTLPQRKAACECVKSSLSNIPGLDPKAAQTLPDKCNVKATFPVGTDVDCSKIEPEL